MYLGLVLVGDLSLSLIQISFKLYLCSFVLTEAHSSIWLKYLSWDKGGGAVTDKSVEIVHGNINTCLLGHTVTFKWFLIKIFMNVPPAYSCSFTSPLQCFPVVTRGNCRGSESSTGPQTCRGLIHQRERTFPWRGKGNPFPRPVQQDDWGQNNMESIWYVGQQSKP